MCKNCYEQYVERTGRNMLFCKKLELKTEEFERLCVAQRYCSDRDKYIPFKQNERCKNYE